MGTGMSQGAWNVEGTYDHLCQGAWQGAPDATPPTPTPVTTRPIAQRQSRIAIRQGISMGSFILFLWRVYEKAVAHIGF